MEVDSGADPKEDLAAGVRRSEGTDGASGHPLSDRKTLCSRIVLQIWTLTLENQIRRILLDQFK